MDSNTATVIVIIALFTMLTIIGVARAWADRETTRREKP